MVADLARAGGSPSEVDDAAADLLTSPGRPIVLLPRRPGRGRRRGDRPGEPQLGVMLPYTPLHHLLLRRSTARSC
jgi:hydrogenase maturation protein HypF